MAILTERKTWRRPSPPKPTRPASLTAEERGNIAAALTFLRYRFGSWEAMAKATGANAETLKSSGSARRKLGVGLALVAARAAGVTVDDVLAGRFPAEGACPLCGRCGGGSGEAT